jgi:hypothetical protein
MDPISRLVYGFLILWAVVVLVYGLARSVGSGAPGDLPPQDDQ